MPGETDFKLSYFYSRIFNPGKAFHSRKGGTTGA